MPFLDLVLRPTSIVLHPVDHWLATQQNLSRHTLLHLTVRFDGTHIVLYHLTGDQEVVDATLARRDDVLDWEIVSVTREETTPPNTTTRDEETAPSDGDGLHAFIHLDRSAVTDRLVDLAHDCGLIIDPPITFADESLRVTVVGTETSLQHLLQSFPETIECSVHAAGKYDPDGTDLLSRLTTRQFEVLETAVDHGYYEILRRATHRELAGILGCAPSTVDEHLRKAESTIVRQLFS